MKFESKTLKNGCTTTLSMGEQILRKEEIVEFNGREFQVSKADKYNIYGAIGYVATYVYENQRKVKIGLWWTNEMLLMDSVKYYYELNSKYIHKQIATIPKKYSGIREEIKALISELDDLNKF